MKKWAQKQAGGFTIVELLIVVVVIAILAAITIVSYNGIQNSAKASAAQTAASQAAQKILAYAVENAEQYPLSLETVGIIDSASTSYQYTVNNSATPPVFCSTVTVTDVSYYVTQAQTSPQAGGCPGHGQNGKVAVTNLATNPSFETTTGAVEVLRNRVGNPGTISGGLGVASGAGSGSYVDAYHRNTATGASGTHYSYPSVPAGEATAGRYTVSNGQKFAWRVKVRNPNATTAYYILGAAWYDGAGAGVNHTLLGTLESISPGGTAVLEFSGVVPNVAGLTGMLPLIYAANSGGSIVASPAGWRLDTTEWALYTGATAPVSPLPYFSGSTPASGDFTYSWMGGENNSASIQSGVGVAAYGTPGSVAKGIRSTEWTASGSASLRQIPVYATRGSAYTELASTTASRGLVAGKTYTIIATCRLIQVQGFTLNGATRSLVITGTIDGVYNKFAMAPDTIGAHVVRMTFTVPPGGPWYLRLYNGGQIGDPDIWWDNIMIVEGEYNGAYGDGNSTGWIWNGAAHNATSTGPSP